MEIINVKTDALKGYENNAKLHSKRQVELIANSIEQFGFNNPVLIDENNVIIAGHGRVEAAKSIKLKAVPCIKLKHLTEEQKRAYILADNRLSEIGGGWDIEKLSLELKEIHIDIESLGFDLAEAESMMKTSGTDLNSMDSAYNLSNNITKEKEKKTCPHCGKQL